MKKLKTVNGFSLILILSATALLLSGCANNEAVKECLNGQTYGFWHGLLHGQSSFNHKSSVAYGQIADLSIRCDGKASWDTLL